MTLPCGTVTFLFTDIEGSTHLWEAHPQAMRAAIVRHDALAEAIIGQHHGTLVKSWGEGDSLFVVFARASEALACACALQQTLCAHSWPPETPLRVRMALHTGEADLRDADYYGGAVNRCARLRAIGHGGQVLVSAATQELVRDALPPSCSLKSLGEHRLRDLSRPESVFQLLHPTLPADFPPLKSLDNPALPNNLPLQLTSFVGREKEIEEVERLLEKTRLLTLTGSGGCGKTRLALQVAADVLEQFPDGAWLVELASLSDPALLAQTVAQALGIQEQAGQSLQQTLTDSLKSRRLLLVLDNCEHLLSACAQLTGALLRSCPQVKALMTSREPLGVAGEQTYRVPSLSVPDPKQTLPWETLSQYEAVHLFIERAMLVKSDFAVNNQNAPAVAQVCSHLDGIPLAIELAAARVRSLSVEDINAHLDNRFRLLTGGDRTALLRQQTLRATIDWSYDLLNAQEKQLLARLSVFAGGWTLSSAEQVGVGESGAGASIEEWAVLDLLTSLVDKSLVIAEEQESTERYHLLETVRQYGVERLQASGETERVRSRHRDWCVALAEEAEPKLYGPEQAQWLQQLEREHDNLRLALAWCLEEQDGAEAGLRLSGALGWFWVTRGHISEGRAHLERALGREGAQARTTARANAIGAAERLTLNHGETASARELYEESLSLFREIGDRRGIAYAHNGLGDVVCEQGDLASARAHFEESLTIGRELEDRGRAGERQEGLAAALLGQAERQKAVRLWGAADALRGSLGAPLPPNEREKYDQQVAQARSALGEDAFTAAWEEGRAMTWEQAAACALGESS